jgi:hypothetical protein
MPGGPFHLSALCAGDLASGQSAPETVMIVDIAFLAGGLALFALASCAVLAVERL